MAAHSFVLRGQMMPSQPLHLLAFGLVHRRVIPNQIPCHNGCFGAASALRKELGDQAGLESGARRLVERMAVLLEASLLLRHGDPMVAELFCASRLEGDWGHTFGSLKPGVELRPVIERHRPRLHRER